ncbi:MAG TPA: PfkB family carbohydrate kinase [Thermoanaerobaculia bacterium]|nr:PfkB family carbohydrate kinase [Thermoanaerobaculia bacterium]HUM30499.1 PfkB family carbohydrate kinase [Thermoanaerobaculia bacterium]HXK68634.1 PfkB family carbohydrate kinase [Thermoanaerobaculia bacterium]
MHTAPTPERLSTILSAIKGRSIPVLADLVVDRYLYGVPKRISREAPVLILSFDRDWMVPGGGANTISNLQALGAKPVPAGIIGDDPPGRFLLDTFGDHGMDLSHLRVLSDAETLTKMRILAGPRSGVKQQVVRMDMERSFESGTVTLPALSEGDLLAVSDYGYNTVCPDAILKLRDRGIRVIVDSRYRLAQFPGVFAVTPNEEEACAFLGREFRTPEEALEGAEEIRGRLEAAVVLLTRGSEGMVLSVDGLNLAIPVFGSDQPADVTGAGDTVLAAFAAAMASGATPLEAATLANIAGGIVVMKLGTAVCTPAEIRKALGIHAG